MKRSLFKRQQRWPNGIAPCALRKQVDTLAVADHLLRSALHDVAGARGVCAVDKDGAAGGHPGPEDGEFPERAFCRDAAEARKHGAEHQDVELGLMVPDKDGGTGAGEHAMGVEDVEGDATGQPGGPGEETACNVLRGAAETKEAEERDGNEADETRGNEAGVRGEGARKKGADGDDG